jgi:glycosyltransferase involved in cell wall biosynthesis
MTDPRILVVAPRLDVGGAEIHLFRILPRIRQAGLDVGLFTIARGGTLENEFVAAGVPVLGASMPGPRLWRSAYAAYTLRREIRRRKPDILHFFLPEPALIGALASFGLREPVHIMSRRSLAFYRHNHPLITYFDRRVTRSMDILIGNSSAVAAELVEDCDDPGKVGMIHNGVDLPPLADAHLREAARSVLGVPQDAFVIAVVANLIPYKGHEDLIAALGRVRCQLHASWRLLLIGKDQGIGGRLKAQAEGLGIGDNILWLGERADSRDLLAGADLGILPSHQEGFSNSLIEMMAQGLPVIASRVGGNIDAVADGESGLLVPVGNVDALGDAILRLYVAADQRSAIGAAARSRAAQLFSLERCLEGYLHLYRSARETRPVSDMINPPESRSGDLHGECI